MTGVLEMTRPVSWARAVEEATLRPAISRALTTEAGRKREENNMRDLVRKGGEKSGKSMNAGILGACPALPVNER
jgi:hypothetical protein